MDGASPLDVAANKLEQAVAQLERRLTQKLARASQEGGLPFDRDRAGLAAELDASRAREKALEKAGAEASGALARAIAEMRVVLGEEA